ncbi:hypothetical protein Godav_028692 [Gossypium davidsonii]|uniref:Protein kinase domain-containing protein n=1 Tax=Gossypium davidsonii TaxID=34287 RepID=A0A7J8S101_GOSDV|nr:hypothetical protein [Gossypium davidsonii]
MILEVLLDIHGKRFIHSDLKPGIRYYMSLGSIFEEVSGALDIWSLGCIEVQMIMGKLPWDTRDQDELRDKLLRGESPSILEDMSKLGNGFLKECFAIDPNKR